MDIPGSNVERGRKGLGTFSLSGSLVHVELFSFCKTTLLLPNGLIRLISDVTN